MQQKLIINGKEETIEIISRDKSYIAFIYSGEEYRFHIDGSGVLRDDSHKIYKTHSGKKSKDGSRNIWVNGHNITIATPSLQRKKSAIADSGDIMAPMNGTIMQLLVKNGDKVKKGQKLVVMEAMKLQISLDAPFDGRISALDAKAGQQVGQGQVLVKVEK